MTERERNRERDRVIERERERREREIERRERGEGERQRGGVSERQDTPPRTQTAEEGDNSASAAAGTAGVVCKVTTPQHDSMVNSQ